MLNKTKFINYSQETSTQSNSIISNTIKYVLIKKSYNPCANSFKRKYKKLKSYLNTINKKYKKVKKSYNQWHQLKIISSNIE